MRLVRGSVTGRKGAFKTGKSPWIPNRNVHWANLAVCSQPLAISRARALILLPVDRMTLRSDS